MKFLMVKQLNPVLNQEKRMGTQQMERYFRITLASGSAVEHQ